MSSLAEAVTISKSPSPSTSATNMPLTLSSDVDIASFLVKLGFLSPSFSYQPSVSSCVDT